MFFTNWESLTWLDSIISVSVYFIDWESSAWLDLIISFDSNDLDSSTWLGFSLDLSDKKIWLDSIILFDSLFSFDFIT